MKRLETCEQLLAVANGFRNYVYNKFVNDEIAFCHPIIEAIFLPKGSEFLPKEYVFNVQVSSVLLTSKDGQNWSANYNDMIDTVLRGEDFYIADLRLKVYMSIEGYMLKDVLQTLNRNINELVCISSNKWKDSQLGELSYLTIDELFKS
jgi:hypothetical protein